MRDLMRRAAVTMAAAAAAGVLAAGMAAGAAAATTTVTPAEAPLPANAASNPEAGLGSVSCASAGNCTAVGEYFDSGGNTQGLLLTQTSGTWAAGTEAPVPGNAASNPVVDLSAGVSCASAGNCTAVGIYVDSSGNTQALLLTQTSGTWAVAEAPLPANAGPNPDAGLSSVSCASAGNCTAVGSYVDSSGNPQGLLLTQAAAQATTTTTLATPANPVATGQMVTYTATVSPAPSGGTVSFADNGLPIAGCGSQPVNTSTGTATCATTPGTTGAHNIVAAYSGTTGYAASTSATVTQVVTKTPCQSLAGCNLSGLNLANAQLAGADLKGANLAGANLADATVTGANFNKVTWSNTTCPDGTNSNADGGTCTGHL
jgi:hypothetical protein